MTYRLYARQCESCSCYCQPLDAQCHLFPEAIFQWPHFWFLLFLVCFNSYPYLLLPLALLHFPILIIHPCFHNCIVFVTRTPPSKVFLPNFPVFFFPPSLSHCSLLPYPYWCVSEHIVTCGSCLGVWSSALLFPTLPAMIY